MDPAYAGEPKLIREVQVAAGALGLQVVVLNASTEREVDAAFATLERAGRALVVAVPSYFPAVATNSSPWLPPRLPAIYHSGNTRQRAA